MRANIQNSLAADFFNTIHQQRKFADWTVMERTLSQVDTMAIGQPNKSRSSALLFTWRKWPGHLPSEGQR
jgi:hypothetical protein